MSVIDRIRRFIRKWQGPRVRPLTEKDIRAIRESLSREDVVSPAFRRRVRWS